MRARVPLLIVFFVVAGVVAADDYPEQPTTTTYQPSYMVMSGGVPGPPLTAGGPDPDCNELNACCRRICGDTPAGKRAGGILGESISPPDYARFIDFPGGKLEVYNKGDHDRVCRRVKNWGQFTWKVFTVHVGYANTKLMEHVSAENTKMEQHKEK